MSKASKNAIIGAAVFSAGCVLYAFYDKQMSLATLRKNVVKERELQRLKKQNLLDLERNIKVEEQYKKALTEKGTKEPAVS